MKIPALLALVCIVLFGFLVCRQVHGQNAVQYSIQLWGDGSSSWRVLQTFANVSDSLGSLSDFHDRVVSLISDVANVTGRSMAAEDDEFSLTFNYSGSYVLVEYRFGWMNFSQVGESNLTLGDVFKLPGLFSSLFGDGQLSMTYPTGFVVDSVSPVPSSRDDPTRTLRWPGTLDFNSNTLIVLTKSNSSGLVDSLVHNGALVGVVVAAVVVVSAGIYLPIRRRKKHPGPQTEKTEDSLRLESDEEKILKFIKLSGGKVRQSEIKESLRFSKAKTSQILSALERQGSIQRYKQGRDKIVVLIERSQE